MEADPASARRIPQGPSRRGERYRATLGIGNAFLQSPLSYAFSATGLVVWLVLVLVLSVVASIMPARSAWRFSVRESLAYE